MMSNVVVGLADRPGVTRMLGWAITEAAASGARLVIVRAEVRRQEVLRAVVRGGGPALDEVDPVLARAMSSARAMLGDDHVGVAADRDSAGPALVRAARAGDLVVVGAPTVSGWWGRGSTAYYVMTRAPCPVAAIHDPVAASSDHGSGRPFPGQVVVGVDGSPAAHAAMEFAFAYAVLHGIPVVAAMATRHPVEDVWFDDHLLETHLGSEPAEAALLAGYAEPWHLKYPDVAVRRAVVGGDAVEGLRRVSRDAALLVVGTAADRTAPLGRVSRSLVEWAGCPVAVVRPQP
jgi:nucleotide-binding universal stress UspA family protein